MSLTIASTPAIQPAEPPSFFCQPIQWISEKVKQVAEAVFGYLLRICYFQTGEFKVPGAYYIMRAYQKLTSNPKEEGPIDSARLEDAKKLLGILGAAETTLIPADGDGEVFCMTFTTQQFWAGVAALGGHIQEINMTEGGARRRALVMPSTGLTDDQKKFLGKLIKRFPPVDIHENGQINTGGLLPEPVKAAQPPMNLRCRTPGRTALMDQVFIVRSLAAGCDVCVFDWRGTLDNPGTPSEGGYSLDADAAFKYVRSLGYQPPRIYLSSMCAGLANGAAYLKAKYHDEGVHLIIENGFHSMRALVEHFVRIFGSLARSIADCAIPATQSQNPAITSRVEQDGFDVIHKFSQLKRGTGKTIIISTDTDTTVPPDSTLRLLNAAQKIGETHFILREHPDKNADGHLQPPSEDENVFRRITALMA